MALTVRIKGTSVPTAPRPPLCLPDVSLPHGNGVAPSHPCVGMRLVATRFPVSLKPFNTRERRVWVREATRPCFALSDIPPRERCQSSTGLRALVFLGGFVLRSSLPYVLISASGPLCCDQSGRNSREGRRVSCHSPRRWRRPTATAH